MDWVVWCIYINDTRYAYNLLYIFEYVEKVTMNIYEHLFKFAMSRFIFLNIKSRRIYPRLKVLSFVCEVLHLFFLVRMPHDACSYDVWMFVLFYVGWDENGVVFEQFQHLKWFVNHFKCHCNCMVFFLYLVICKQTGIQFTLFRFYASTPNRHVQNCSSLE